MELGLGITKIVPPIVYFVGVVVILLTLFWKIDVGLYFLVPIFTQQSLLEHMRGYPMGKDFIDLLFLVLTIRWFLNGKKEKNKYKWRKSLNVLLPMIFIWTFIGLWVGAYVLQTGSPLSMSDPRFLHWKNFIMLPFLYVIVVNNIENEKQIRNLLLLMTLSMLYMDRSFYNNFAIKDHSNFSYDLRVGSTFSYLGPNEVAVFYAQNSIILLALWVYAKERKEKWLFAVTTIFNYYCLMFLYSRGGYLAALMSWVYYGLTRDKRVLVVLAIFLTFWRVFLPASVQQRIDMSKTKAGTDSSITERYEMWDQAEALIKSSPVIGLGYNVTPYMGIHTGEKHRNSLHNGYLELLLEEGAIGLAIFLAFFITGFRLGWRLYKTGKSDMLKALGLGYGGCVLAVLAGNIAGSYWFYLNVSAFFYVNLALVVRGLEISEAAGAEETPPEGHELEPAVIAAS